MTPRLELPVRIPSASYLVTVGEGLLAETGGAIARLCPGSRAFMVTDDNVFSAYGATVRESLTSAGIACEVHAIQPGESSKSWDVAGQVLERMAAAGVDRSGVVIALGGGVVGDLAGFCAAVFMRGIAFVQIPTTLLAQVDSSVGGKTAVDLVAGKNLAGAFKQPLAVFADTGTLGSLPEREWASGLAEVAKTALLAGDEAFSALEAQADLLAVRDPDVVARWVARAVEFKASVVASDEREEGVREHLNLGHTLGHAIERVAGYGVLTHGEAVAEGLRFAAGLAEEILGAEAALAHRTGRVLDRLGLPALWRTWDADALRDAMASDKKARGSRPRFVLVREPGDIVVDHVDEAVLMERLGQYARAVRGEGERA